MAALNLSTGLTTFNYTNPASRSSSSVGWSLNINIGTTDGGDSLFITTNGYAGTYYVESNGTLTPNPTPISYLEPGVYLFSVSGIIPTSNLHRVIILNVSGVQVYRTARASGSGMAGYETNGVFNFTGPITINSSNDRCYLMVSADSDQGFMCRDMKASICRIA